MGSNELKRRETFMDFEIATKSALDRFFELHPKESLPAWVNRCVTIGGFQDPLGSWVVEVTVNPKTQLKENEFWEIRHGRKVLAMTDPRTGQKRIVIHRSSSEPVVIFRAAVDAATSLVQVQIDSDLSQMNGELYEPVDQ